MRGFKYVKKCFFSTFDVSEKFVRNILDRRNEAELFSPDKRGRHDPGNKIPQEAREYIKEHINSIPKVPSHYCRANSSCEYFPSDLNLTKLYELYVDKCSEDNVEKQKFWYYRDVFLSDFNIKFHIPRKDVCDVLQL
uniref:Uncharacterized protein n=1 Tax=Cacopsylla melanoneura TaxID=428564 RepID=A0A8D8QTT3_9HEMI